MVETIGFFLVLWQESWRLELRTSHRSLAVPPDLQRVYYYNFGDLANGYVNAFLLDGLTTLGIAWLARRRPPRQGRWWQLPRTRAWVATAASALLIVIVELHANAFTNADWRDIPAGVGGALCYLIMRHVGLRAARRPTEA